MENEKILKLLSDLKQGIKAKQWIEEVYIPYYNSTLNQTEGDSGGNPTPTPPPPPGIEDNE